MRSTTDAELFDRLSNSMTSKPAIMSSTQVCEAM
jgi:hypothetical protein